jgi:outer membrane protein assembly factor BamB
MIFDGNGLAGHDATTGKELWRYPWETQQGINVAQPLVLEGDRVFVSSGYGVGCAVLQVKESGPPELLWKNRHLSCRFSSPMAYRGHVYGLNEGTLVCLDEKTGERRGRGGRYGHGQLLQVNDVLLVLAESGKLVAVEATPDHPRELGSFAALAGGKTWNTFAVVDGKAYVRNHEEMACYDLGGEAP